MAAPKTKKVQITSTADGPRYVHTTTGTVMIRPGQTTDELEMLEADLADLPAGLSTDGAPSAAPAQEGGAGDEIPADLADKSSNDGLIKRDEMIAIAVAAGVEMDGRETKADLLAKIKAARG